MLWEVDGLGWFWGQVCLVCLALWESQFLLRAMKSNTVAEDGLLPLVKSPHKLLIDTMVLHYTIITIYICFITGLDVGLHVRLPRPNLYLGS